MALKRADKHVDTAAPATGPRAVADSSVIGREGPRPFTPRVVLTEGQRLFALVDATLDELAEALGVTPQAVSLWRHGDRNPGPAYRRRIEQTFGIPPDTWNDEPVGGFRTASTEDDAEDEADDADELEQDDAEDEPEPVPEPPRRRNRRAEDEPPDEVRSALDDYNVLLGQLRKQLARSNLPSRERLQLTDAMTRALAHKERLERSREMLESRTIKEHPKWLELKAAIIGALLEHPAAARDVEAAISRVLGDEGAV